MAPDIERVVKKRFERRPLQVQTEQEDQPGSANKPSLAFKTPSRIHNRNAAQAHSSALPPSVQSLSTHYASDHIYIPVSWTLCFVPIMGPSILLDQDGRI